MMPTITKLEFEKKKSEALIIDVRSKLENYTLPTLPNSINIYYKDLINSPTKYIADKNQLIVTYCNFGNRSGQVAQILREKGYKQAFVLKGGIENYFLEKNKLNE